MRMQALPKCRTSSCCAACMQSPHAEPCVAVPKTATLRCNIAIHARTASSGWRSRFALAVMQGLGHGPLVVRALHQSLQSLLGPSGTVKCCVGALALGRWLAWRRGINT